MFIPEADYESYQQRKRQRAQAPVEQDAPDFWTAARAPERFIPSPTGMDGPPAPSFVPLPNGMDGPAVMPPASVPASQVLSNSIQWPSNETMRRDMPGYAGVGDTFQWWNANVTEPMFGALNRYKTAGEAAGGLPPEPAADASPEDIQRYKEQHRAATANASLSMDSELGGVNAIRDDIQSAGGLAEAKEQWAQRWQAERERNPVSSMAMEMFADPSYTILGGIGELVRGARGIAGAIKGGPGSAGPATAKAVQKANEIVTLLPKITNAISGTPMGVAPETGGAVLGGMVYQDDPNLSPLENLARRALYMGAGAAGGHVARRLGSKSRLGGTIEDASRYLEQTQARHAAIQARIGDIEDEVGKLTLSRGIGREAGPTVLRPPNAGSLTNAQLAEVAAAHDISPFQKEWWESIDPEAFKELGPGQRSGKYEAATFVQQQIKRLSAERDALIAEADELTKGFSRKYNLEARKGTERVPAWQDPALTAQAEKVGARPLESLPETAGTSGSVPPGGRRPPTGQDWTPADKPLSNPQPLGPRADALAQLEEALTPTKLTVREMLSEGDDTLRRAMYDKTLDAKIVEEATGIPVHKQIQVVPGSIAYGEFLVDKQVMPVLRSVGKDVEQLEKYMVGMRFGDVLSRNPAAKLPGGVDGWVGKFQAIDQLKQKIGPQRFAAVEAAAKKMWQLNDDLVLKPRLEAGLLNKEQYVQIKSANPHYISFYRKDFVGLQTSFSKGGGTANVTHAGLDVMDLGGSVRKLDRPLVRFQASIVHTQHLIAENKAAKALVQGLLEMEKAGTATKGAAKAPLFSGERFAKIVREGEKIGDSNVWGTVSFLEDGQKVTAQVPAPFAKMAKGLEAEAANFWSSLARAASFPLRAGAVTYNVTFIGRNITRDLISAFFREGVQPFSKEYADGWMAAIAKNSDFEDAARSGALMSGIVDNMRSTNAMARTISPYGTTVASPKDALLLLPRLMRNGLKGIERAGMISEQSTRIATYKKLRGQGLSELESGVRTRDVSVDFSKSGNIMKVINQAIPFSNAGLQGAANTLRTWRYNPKQAIVGSSPLVAMTVLAWTWNQRYETSKMIPEREYANNWIIQYGEGTKAPDPKFPNKPPEKFPLYQRIPKGSIGAMITAPAEVALRYAWANNDRSVLDDVGATFLTMGTALSPVDPSFGSVVPPLGSTLLGIESGYDTFRQQPIVPRSEQDRIPELQYGSETSREAVLLGEKFHVSPRVIDWAIKDATAGVGSQTLWLSDLILGAVGYESPPVYGEAKRRPFTAEQALAKNPFTGGFLGTQNSEQTNRGWDALDKAVMEGQRTAATIPELRELGITFSEVSEKAAVGKHSIVLTPQERAELQTITNQVLVGLVPYVTKNPDYKTYPLPLKIKAMQAVMDKGREAARNSYLGRFSESDLERRVIESLPVAVE